MRFYDPKSGRILFDNHDLKNLSLLQLRTLVRQVDQDPQLRNISLLNNIALGLEFESEKQKRNKVIEVKSQFKIYLCFLHIFKNLIIKLRFLIKFSAFTISLVFRNHRIFS